jgi:nucleoside-diphosphate-sugar epimerase
MNILVTGACGFIGTNLCQSLLEDGHHVTGVDAFTENYSVEVKRQNQRKLLNYENFSFIEADLLNCNLNPIFADKEIVYHMAGQPSVHNSWGEDFQIYINRNILLTQKLLQAAVKSKTRKFINSSSSSVYGRVMTTPTSEKDSKTPISPYGVTKLAAENLVTLFSSEFGLDTVSLRYFTVYGPGQRPDMAFNKLIAAAASGLSFPLHGDGSQIRDFTFVGDVVNANKLAGSIETPAGSIFNVGGGSPVSMNHAISLIEQIMGKKIIINNVPIGPGNPTITTANCFSIEDALGWKSKVGILEGLNAQIEWQM